MKMARYWSSIFKRAQSKMYFPSEEDGFILVITLVVLIVLTIIGFSATRNTTIELQIAGNDRLYKDAFYHADGGEEIGIQAVEENLSCPLGFTRSTMSPTDNKDPDVFFDAQGVQFADDKFALAETINDLPAAGIITLADVPSDTARSMRIPVDMAAANDTDPHTNVAVYGKTFLSAGSAIQMAAGYEGRGKGTGGSGAYIAYNVHSQHIGLQNSNTRLRVDWRHLVGQEGECNY